MEPTALRTPRAQLLPPSAADVSAMFLACQDSEIQRWTTLPSPYKRSHARDYVDHATRSWMLGTEHTWVIRSADEFSGVIGLRNGGTGAAEIGYWIAPSARGKGLISEVGRTVIDWAFSPAGAALERIEWRAYVGNTASARSARALGFRYEGLLRRGLAQRGQRHDGWIAGLLACDDRTPQAWPMLPNG